MGFLLDLVEQYGLLFVFFNVLIEQFGMPIPAYPKLVITSALLGPGHYPALGLLITAAVAVLIADFIWYWAGRKYGGGVRQSCAASHFARFLRALDRSHLLKMGCSIAVSGETYS